MKYFLTFFVSFVSLSTFAGGGNIIGNGGDAVICPNKKPEVLDIVEARTLNSGFKFGLGEKNLSVENKLSIALERLRKHAPARAEKYSNQARYLLTSDPFIDKSLEDLQDSDHMDIVIPYGCAIRQAAVQFKETVGPNDKKYLINRPLYQSMDNDNKVALILHEIVYTEAITFGHTDSRKVRKVVSYLVSSSFDNMTDANFYDVFNKANFLDFEIAGLRIERWTQIQEYPPLFFPNGRLARAFVVSGKWPVQDKYVYIQYHASFFSNGVPYQLRIAQDTELKDINGRTRQIKKGSSIQLNEAAAVVKIF